MVPHISRPKIMFILLIFAVFTLTVVFRKNTKLVSAPTDYASQDNAFQMILRSLHNIEKKLSEQNSYLEYKAFRDKIKLSIPKLIKNENDKINVHVLGQPKKNSLNENYHVLVLVSSNAPHDWRRDAIRQNWGNSSMWSRTETWRVLFVIGGSKDKGVMNKLQIEAQKYNDLLIEDVEESFYSLSKKVMIGLQWAHTNINYEFILKCDDDIFIQMDRLMRLIENNRDENYFGQVMYKQPVMRKGRYELTEEEHKNDYFDPYCSGGAFVISFDAVNRIIPLFDWFKPLKIDDAYIGQLVFQAGIKEKHENGFHLWNRWCEYTDVLLVSHPVKNEICMSFLTARSMIENGKLHNDTLKNQKYAFDEEARKKL